MELKAAEMKYLKRIKDVVRRNTLKEGVTRRDKDYIRQELDVSPVNKKKLKITVKEEVWPHDSVCY